MSAGIVHVYFLQVGTTNYPRDQSGEKNIRCIKVFFLCVFVLFTTAAIFLLQEKNHLEYRQLLHSDIRFIRLGGKKINPLVRSPSRSTTITLLMWRTNKTKAGDGGI